MTRSVHPSGSDVGIDIYHLDGYEVVDHSRCDEGSFPDLDAHEDLGTTAICGYFSTNFPASTFDVM